MSEPLGPTGGDGFGGPASRPSGDGLPPRTGGGMTPVTSPPATSAIPAWKARATSARILAAKSPAA